MNVRTKIYIASAAAVLFAIGVLGGSAMEWRKLRELDRRITDATHAGAEMKRAADARETEANGYREKIAYLESMIAEGRSEAAKQDEKIKHQTNITGNARADVARARGVRSGDASVDKLCRKLEALGHKCTRE